MGRYIDADGIPYSVMRDFDGKQISITTKDRVDKVPTADVAPVVHAHWVYEGIFYGNAEYTCSRCNRNAVVYTSVERSHVDAVYPYCHCGAKMDEEVEQ